MRFSYSKNPSPATRALRCRSASCGPRARAAHLRTCAARPDHARAGIAMGHHGRRPCAHDASLTRCERASGPCRPDPAPQAHPSRGEPHGCPTSAERDRGFGAGSLVAGSKRENKGKLELRGFGSSNSLRVTRLSMPVAKMSPGLWFRS